MWPPRTLVSLRHPQAIVYNLLPEDPTFFPDWELAAPRTRRTLLPPHRLPRHRLQSSIVSLTQMTTKPTVATQALTSRSTFSTSSRRPRASRKLPIAPRQLLLAHRVASNGSPTLPSLEEEPRGGTRTLPRISCQAPSISRRLAATALRTSAACAPPQRRQS
jgi:hypothetical protein